jgi:DegV family protein with EDD domain
MAAGTREMSVKIIVDSACDISQDDAQKQSFRIIPLKTMFGNEEYLDGVTMTHREFFEKLVETDEFPHTSQIPPFEYQEAFEEAVSDGSEVLCITISSKISGCYQSACIAADDVDGKVIIVDSENASMGERILVERALELKDEGKTASEIADILNEEKKDIRLIALLDTLEYLKKGGRISPAVAAVGSMLSIKPVIAISDGEVKVLGKARGSKNGNNLLTELLRKEGDINFDRPYSIAYSGLNDSVLQKYIADNKALFEGHCTTEELPVTSIGCAIGSHIGPGAIGAAFFVKKQ